MDYASLPVTGEEVADVRVEHPVHLPLADPDRQRVERVVWAAPWSEPVGEAEEVLLVDGVQHLDGRWVSQSVDDELARRRVIRRS